MAEGRPRVAIVMGSDSDLPTMRQSAKLLEGFGIGYTMRISSAHRTPKETAALAESFEEAGVEIVIVGAGLAAHLAGVIASITTLPVIGVPMGGGSLQGVDALYSTVQMPGGVPVATMSIGKHGAKNAAILAAQILALSDPAIRDRLRDFREQQTLAVQEKDRALTAGEL